MFDDGYIDKSCSDAKNYDLVVKKLKKLELNSKNCNQQKGYYRQVSEENSNEFKCAPVIDMRENDENNKVSQYMSTYMRDFRPPCEIKNANSYYLNFYERVPGPKSL
jgi:hypothetical protein